MAIKNGMVSVFSDKDLKTSVKNIECPLHHRIKPGLPLYEAWEIEPNPMAKNFSDEMCQRFGLRKWKYKRDRFGNRIPNYNNHFQPEISALYAKEKIYTPDNPVCRKCRRCLQ